MVDFTTEIGPESRGMVKILQTTFARQLGTILLLAPALVLPSRAAAPALTTLYSFTDLADGGFPEAGLVLGTGGTLYGTTSTGGSGWGSVFELLPGANSTFTEKTIYTFTGGADGGNPVAKLVLGKSNVLYGTTYSGGAHGYGTVFQVAPVGSGNWTQKVLYSFANGTDGAYPAAGLVYQSTLGVLYGTTYGGGSAGLGTIFELLPGTGGIWTEKVIYTFLGGTDGANPISDLALSSSGSLYGTTSQGGSGTNSSGAYANWGTVFQLSPKGGGVWAETVLYTFTGGTDGGSPESAVLLGPAGVLYGSAFWGGIAADCTESAYLTGCGVVYQLAPPTSGSGPWTQTVLYSFTGTGTDGAHPYQNMTLYATTGQLFGATFAGGSTLDICFQEAYAGCGTVFSVKPPATKGNPWTKSNMIVFPGSPGAGAPNGLVQSSGGALYGTTILGGNTGGYGTVYLLTL